MGQGEEDDIEPVELGSSTVLVVPVPAVMVPAPMLWITVGTAETVTVPKPSIYCRTSTIGSVRTQSGRWSGACLL